MPLRVLHLSGSAVDEFTADLSRLYARDALAATADPERYAFHVADVSPDGRWRFPADLSRAALDAAEPLGVADAIGVLTGLDLDVVVPQMFCLPGMTHYRALFDVLGVPYLGNPPEVMALAADKAKARAVVAAAGVDVPAGEVLGPGERPTIAAPAVVKPVDADNSAGVALARDAAGYDAALATARAHGDRVLVEEFVPLGREVRCGIVVRDGELVGLPLEEYAMDATSKPIRGQDDKIARADGGDLRLVAKDPTRAWIVDPDDPVCAAVWAAAKRCHVAMGARHYSLFDFRIDPTGRPWFLEAGPYCSFARQSVVSVMAAAAGIGLDDLFATTIAAALGDGAGR